VKKMYLIVFVLVVVVAGLVRSTQVLTYNGSTRHDVAMIVGAVEHTSSAGKPVYSADQIAIDDSVRLRLERRGYQIEAESPGRYQVCAPLYQYLWSRHAGQITCQTAEVRS